jgi:hypothetical protein
MRAIVRAPIAGRSILAEVEIFARERVGRMQDAAGTTSKQREVAILASRTAVFERGARPHRTSHLTVGGPTRARAA